MPGKIEERGFGADYAGDYLQVTVGPEVLM